MSSSNTNAAAAAERPPCRRFVGKTAIVTAATAGIGLGIARRLAQEGARVMICSRCVCLLLLFLLLRVCFVLVM
jgi:3-oxoacyl-ACP reductase-like protein